MTTDAEIAEAARLSRKRVVGNCRAWLRVRWDGLSDRDRKLCERVMEIVRKGDGEALEAALANQEVNDLFRDGALYFERPI